MGSLCLKRRIWTVSCLVFFGAVVAIGVIPDTSQAADPAPKREKNLDFEDNTVEGVNRQALDSLQHLSKKKARRKHGKLYSLREDLTPYKDRIAKYESEVWARGKK